MQRAKHADRKQRTRRLIVIGAAAERAGAAHLAPDEIEAVLAHYVQTSGEPDLRAYVSKHRSRVEKEHELDGNRAKDEVSDAMPDPAFMESR